MKNWKKGILGVALSFMVFFTAIGYAALTDNLTINGTLSATAPNDIFITKITSIEGLPTTQTGLRTMKTTVSGGEGAKITYAIEVKNNTDDTYVYAGASEPFTAWTVDEDGNSPFYEITNAYSTGPLIGARETLTIYVQYTFMSAIETPAVASVEFYFKKPIYTIEYINNNVLLDTRYIYNNNNDVETKNDDVAATAEDLMGEGEHIEFAYWMNSGSSKVEYIPAGYPGTGDSKTVTLFPKFNAPYTAMFVDQDGSLLAWCFFNNEQNSKYLYSKPENVPQAMSDATLAANDILDDLEYHFEIDYWIVRGDGIDPNDSDKDGSKDKVKYDLGNFAGYDKDVTIYPHYKYMGADLGPIDDGNDGDVDHYEVKGYPESSGGTTLVVIPSDVNGAPVTIINPDAFSSFDDLHSVVIPETVTTINSQAFSADTPDIWNKPSTWGTQRDTITMYYEGDPATWRTAMDMYNADNYTGMLKANWDNCMGDGSRVFFLVNGKVDLSKGYWELNNDWIWYFHNHTFPYSKSGASCSSAHRQDDTDYDGACDCDFCDGATRPDVEYWDWTLTYNYNDGVTPSTTVDVVYDGAITLPTPTSPSAEYTFAGWYTEATGGTRAGGAGDSYQPTGVITLYAQWTTTATVSEEEATP